MFCVGNWKPSMAENPSIPLNPFLGIWVWSWFKFWVWCWIWGCIWGWIWGCIWGWIWGCICSCIWGWIWDWCMWFCWIWGNGVFHGDKSPCKLRSFWLLSLLTASIISSESPCGREELGCSGVLESRLGLFGKDGGREEEEAPASETQPGPYPVPGGKAYSILLDATFQATGPRFAANRARLLAYAKGSCRPTCKFKRAFRRSVTAK